MLSYDTGITSKPPITPAMQQRALAGLQAYAPPGQAGDVYNAAAQDAAVNYERAAADANNKHLLNSQQAQQSTSLQGLQALAQQNQNANNLANKRQEMSLGYANQMFNGLNGLLAGLW